MGSFCNYVEKKLLDHLLGKSSFTAPTIYVGLSTADPGEDGSGISEPSGGAYARVSTEASDWNSVAEGVGEADNAADITFPEATGDWGTLTHFFLSDNSVAGNYLGHGQLASSLAVGSGTTVKFEAGDLSITLD